jgi:hypothetical protein
MDLGRPPVQWVGPWGSAAPAADAASPRRYLHLDAAADKVRAAAPNTATQTRPDGNTRGQHLMSLNTVGRGETPAQRETLYTCDGKSGASQAPCNVGAPGHNGGVCRHLNLSRVVRGVQRL